MLEAVIIACIMVGAVVYVATFDMPPPYHDYAAEKLEQRLRDFGIIAQETPLPPGDCTGRTREEQYVIDLVNGDARFFRGKLDALFEPTHQVNLYLQNGDSPWYPLHVEFENLATAGHTSHFTPDWQWVKPVSQVNSASGTEPLVIDTPALHSNRLLKPEGENVRFTLTLEGTVTKQQIVRYGVTAMPDIDYDRSFSFAQNITWRRTETEEIQLVRNVTAFDLASVNPLEFRLKVEPGLSGYNVAETILPEGLRATVRIPPGWEVDETTTQDGTLNWLLDLQGDVNQGWELTFTLKATQYESDTLRVFARPPASPVKPFDFFHARLGNGSLGESSLVINHPGTFEHTLPRDAFLTVPYPVRHGTMAAFGVAFTNGGDAALIKRIDVEIPGGYDTGPWRKHGGRGAKLFGNGPQDDPVPLDGTTDGHWAWIDERHVAWIGNRTVEASEATYWAFGIPFTDDIGQGTNVDGPGSDGVVSEITLQNGFNSRSTRWGASPGVIRHEVPPESAPGAGDGYPWRASTEAITYNYTTSVTHWRGAVTNHSAHYTILPEAGDLVRVQNALANSTLRVHDRVAPLGSVLQVEAILDSVATELAALGITDITITVSLYPPSSMGCRPAAEWTLDASSSLLAAIRDIELYDATDLGTSPTVLLISDDGNAYRLDLTGTPTWSHELTARGTDLEVARFSSLDHGVFIGQEDGVVARIDYALGTNSWSRNAHNDSRIGSHAITFVDANATSGLVLTGSEDGTLLLADATTGKAVAQRDTSLQNGSYIAATWGPDGDVYALHQQGLEHLTPTLEWEDAAPQTDGKRVTYVPYGLLVSAGSTTTRLDPDTLTAVDLPIMHTSSIVLTEMGDATGDGTPDLVLALASLQVDVIDGATGAVTSRTPTLATLATLGGGVGSFEPPTLWYDPNTGQLGGHWDDEDSIRYEQCEQQEDESVTYRDGKACVTAGNPNNQKLAPLAIRAAQGHILYAYQVGATSHVEHWGVTVAEDWYDQQEVGAQPLALALGPWAPSGARVAVVGSTDGKLTAHDAATGFHHWEVQPTDFVGAFTFNMAIPQGGFFGTHIILVTLGWTDADGVEHSARLSDWFDVVKKDGTPDVFNRYLLQYRAQDALNPITRKG